MPELDLPQRQTTDTLMLTGFWYRALPADRVHRNQLCKATLLELPLVIGRFIGIEMAHQERDTVFQRMDPGPSSTVRAGQREISH